MWLASLASLAPICPAAMAAGASAGCRRRSRSNAAGRVGRPRGADGVAGRRRHRRAHRHHDLRRRSAGRAGCCCSSRSSPRRSRRGSGSKRKVLLGIAEERGGRRGPGNAIANTGVAAIAAVRRARRDVRRDAARLAFAAALAAGGSDTIASEIGKAWGRRTWSITSLARVPPGTSGAMSLEGTVAGVAGRARRSALAAVALGLAPLGARRRS